VTVGSCCAQPKQQRPKNTVDIKSARYGSDIMSPFWGTTCDALGAERVFAFVL
jgi:hypothetical protein